MLFPLLSSRGFDCRRARTILQHTQASISQPAPSNDNVEEGTLQYLLSNSDDCAKVLFQDLDSAEFQTLSIVLGQLNLKFMNGLGYGGFGSVFMVSHAPSLFAAKLEVSQRTDCALKREALVYSGRCRANRDDVPLPKICNEISSQKSGGTRKHPPNFFASVSLGSGKTVYIMCIELLDVDTPKSIWNEGARHLSQNLEVTASLRYLILDALHATLHLMQKGIAHRDFKWPYHLGLRMNSRQLVVFDLGMAEQNGNTYISGPLGKKSKTSNHKARQNLVEPIITTGCSHAPADTPQHRFGGDQPGTPGYRAPFKADTQELGHFTDIWSAAASILMLLRKDPELDGRQFENELHEVVAKQSFDEFLLFALKDKDCSQMKDSCRRLLKLAYQMFQSTPFDRISRPRPPPANAITTALFSEFALCYIYEEQELERKLLEVGIVIDGKQYPNGKIQRPVLLIKHDPLGLLVFTIFASKANDPACEYFGRKLLISTGRSGDISSASFSMHAISLEPGYILDGAPCKGLPLSAIIKSGRVGALVLSSRKKSDVSLAGSIHLPQRLLGPRTSLQMEGLEGPALESIQMFFRKDVEGGKVQTWDYPWATAQGGLGLSAHQIEEGQLASSPDAIADIERLWLDRINMHKTKILEKFPMYSDAADDRGTQPGDTCSTLEGDGPRGRCTLAGDCVCASESVDCARKVDVQDVFLSSFQSSLTPMQGCVWKQPSMICAEMLEKVSSVAMDACLHKRFLCALSEQGFAIVNGLNAISPVEFSNAIAQAAALAEEHCTHPVFIYPGKIGSRLPETGKQRKLLGYIGGFDNAPANWMRLCMEHVAPGYKIAIGKDRQNGCSVEQCELLLEILPPADEHGELQCVHVDATVGDPQQVHDCMDILRANFKYILDSKGPLSLFFPFEKEYRLVVFPTAHKPAIECLKNFARHYEAARAAFFEARKPKPKVLEWNAAWCGCNVQLLRRLFPGETFNPVCVPVDVGGMLAVSGFLPHCGLPVDGIRGFIAATYEVPMS